MGITKEEYRQTWFRWGVYNHERDYMRWSKGHLSVGAPDSYGAATLTACGLRVPNYIDDLDPPRGADGKCLRCEAKDRGQFEDAW